MKRATKIVFILCLFLVSFCQVVFAAEWKEVYRMEMTGKYPGYSAYYVDASSITRNRDIVSAWTRHDSARVQRADSSVKQSSSITKYEFNLKEDKWRMVAVYNSGRVYESIGPWQDVVKNIPMNMNPWTRMFLFCKERAR